jgi:hypothetical protein
LAAAPQPRAARTIVVSSNRGGGREWQLGLLLLFVFLGVAAALYYKHATGEKSSTEEVAANPEQTEPNPEMDFDGLPKIVDDPEKDGERPDVSYVMSDDSDLMLGNSEPEVKIEPPPKPKTTEPKKPPRKPGTIVRETIPNPVPNTYSASSSRTVDLLVLYTKEVKMRYGTPERLLEHVNSMVAYTNMQFNAHNVKKARVRLVGLVEVTYEPTGNLRADIGNLGAGRMLAVGKGSRDKIHTVRDRTGADMVTLLCKANKRGGGGLGMIKGPWAVMDFPVHSIFKHELQHNFGWNHSDRGNFSVIDRNFSGISKWKKKRVSENKLYVQYVVEGGGEAAK